MGERIGKEIDRLVETRTESKVGGTVGEVVNRLVEFSTKGEVRGGERNGIFRVDYYLFWQESDHLLTWWNSKNNN